MLIHVSRDGQQFGPYTPEDVQAYLADGSLLTTDLGWVEGTAEWVPLPQLVRGGAAPPPAIPGITCPKCGAGLEADQVICLACGHNLDEPVVEVTEEANVPQEKRKIPPSLTYEDELADRSSFVNSVGWGLLMAGLMPVFGDGEWKVPAWKFWELAEWQAMYSIIGPVVVGVILIVLASAMHGRNRGIVVLVLGLTMGGLALTDPEIGAFKLATPVEDTSTPIPEPLSSEEAGGTVDIPEKEIELVDKNVFFEKLGLEPDQHSTSITVFLIGWLLLAIGTKSRFYRVDSVIAYGISMLGAIGILVFMFMPGQYGMPFMAAIDAMSNNIFLGVGLLLMMAMLLGAAVLCFINTLGKRPSQMKQWSSLAVTLTVISLAMPVLPTWGKVIYDECRDDHERAEKRLAYVESQFGTIYTGQQASRKDMALNKVEKPISAVIAASCGWLMAGVKYMDWVGGIMILLPLGMVETICGTRERDSDFMVLQQ